MLCLAFISSAIIPGNSRHFLKQADAERIPITTSSIAAHRTCGAVFIVLSFIPKGIFHTSKSALYVNKKMLSVQNKFDFSVNNLPYSDRLTFLHLHKDKLFLISGYKHWLCVEEEKSEGFLCKDAPFCSHDLLPLSDSRSSATSYPLGNSILYVKGYHSGLTILA